MPITIESTPDLGILGQAGFYAGQNNLDDRMKADQMKLQQQQLQQQAYLAQQNQDYDLYKQLASMANQNAQMEYRTMADQVQQFNQQQNANAQMEFRQAGEQQQQANQMAFQGNMAQFQAGERQNAQQEEFRLREQFEKNQLQRHEELRLKRLHESMANVERMRNEGLLLPEEYNDAVAQIQTGISPLEQRQRVARTSMIEMQRAAEAADMTRRNQLDIELQKQRAANPPGSYGIDWNTGNPFMTMLDKNGIPTPLYGGGTTGSSGSKSSAEPKEPVYTPFKEPKAEDLQNDAMILVQTEAIRMKASGSANPIFVNPNPPDANGNQPPLTKDQMNLDNLTPYGAKLYEQAWQTVSTQSDQRRKAHEAEQQRMRQSYEDQMTGRGTWAGIPYAEKMARQAFIQQEAERQWLEQHPGEEFKPNSQEFIQGYLMPMMAIETTQYWKTVADRRKGKDDGTTPLQKNQGVGADGSTKDPPPKPVMPDPITQDRLIGNGVPLTPEQDEVIRKFDELSLATYKPGSGGEYPAEAMRGIAEAKAIYMKYGSLAAMQQNPQDFQRFKELDEKSKVFAKYLEAQPKAGTQPLPESTTAFGETMRRTNPFTERRSDFMTRNRERIDRTGIK